MALTAAPFKLLRAKLWAVAVLLPWTVIPYLAVQRFALRPAVEVPTTAIDRAIPFRPGWTIVYIAFYPLVIVGGLFLSNRNDLRRYAISIALAGLLGYTVFLVWPTTVPRPPVAAGQVGAVYETLVRIDRPLNALPSLHGAYGVIACLGFARAMRTSGIRPLPAAAITGTFWAAIAVVVVSTLLTRQHVLLDLLAGMVLGIVTYCLAGIKRSLTGPRMPAIS